MIEQDLNNIARILGKILTFKVTIVRELTALRTGYELDEDNILVFFKDNPEVNEGDTITIILTGVIILCDGHRTTNVSLENN